MQIGENGIKVMRPIHSIRTCRASKCDVKSNHGYLRSCNQDSRTRNGRRGSKIMENPFLIFTFSGIPKFRRKKVWDPYKRLGISYYASSEEVWNSRNFLLQQYGGDEASVESIERAFERLLMKSFIERKKTKINLKSRLKQKVEESPSWVKNMLNFVELPEKVIILRRLFLFTVLAAWSIMNQAEAGPAFQVAVALAACAYFLYDKSKSLGRASAFGFGSLVAGWICGSFLGPMVPTFILPVTWTLELSTSLVAFVFMFLGCTFLK